MTFKTNQHLDHFQDYVHRTHCFFSYKTETKKKRKKIIHEMDLCWVELEFKSVELNDEFELR